MRMVWFFVLSVGKGHVDRRHDWFIAGVARWLSWLRLPLLVGRDGYVNTVNGKS